MVLLLAHRIGVSTVISRAVTSIKEYYSGPGGYRAERSHNCFRHLVRSKTTLGDRH